MADGSGIFLLGLMCGASGLIALYSILIGQAYRETGLWWLAATLAMGMSPVAVQISSLLAGTSRDVVWGRPSAWLVVSMSNWMLRALLGTTGSMRLPAAGLASVAALSALAALGSIFAPLTGSSLIMGPLWLLAIGMALRSTWARCAPWIFWIAAGQASVLIGWAGLMLMRLRGIEGSEPPAILWKALLLTLFGATTYMGLVWRSRLRSEVTLRVRAIERTDPLTGLALPRIFAQQLDSAGARARAFGYRNALLSLQVTNLRQLAADHELGNDELSLLAASGAIHAVLRPVDFATRVANDLFVVLVEGLAAHESLNELATRFVASGLRADPARGQKLLIKFQCVALETGDEPMSAAALLNCLAQGHGSGHVAELATSIRLLKTPTSA